MNPTRTLRSRSARTVALAAAAVAGAAAATLPATTADARSIKSEPLLHVQLLSINDLHGNLEPPSGSGGRVRVGTNPDGTAANVDAGGAAYLGTHLERLREGKRDTFTLTAGDNIGATPLLSAAFHDEPTIEALNAMDVELSVVGNHEFDEGVAELLRIQEGGCIKDGAGADNQNSCPRDDAGGKRYRGADFDYLAANVVYTSTGKPILAATHIERMHSRAKVGFIGVVTDTTPSIVTASGVAGLTFQDEAEVINKYAAELQAQGVESIVAVMHEGGGTSGLYNDCAGVSDPVPSINAAVSPAVDAIITAHSHAAFNCKLPDPAGNPRLITQAASFGRIITDIDLVIDRRTGDVDRAATSANNVIVTRDVPKHAGVQAVIDEYTGYLGPIASAELGTITADLSRTANGAGESPLGNVLADAAKADATVAGQGEIEIGFINPGGIRADLPYGDGVVTFGEAFSVQPFNNYVVSKSLTGAQVLRVLEQQFDNPVVGDNRILGVSGLTYSWSASAPTGAKVSDVLVNGEPLDPARTYRVAANNFLIEGGDNFTVFGEVKESLYGGLDIDAFAAYLQANPDLAPPALDRITQLP